VKTKDILDERRAAAVKEASERAATHIAECIFFGARVADSEVVAVADEATGRELLKRWMATHAELAASDAEIARTVAEGGFYRTSLKLKLDPVDRYARLYDVPPVAGA
jgi:hypothetical protein